jgi:F-type H+-transporting ATPase subunit epsilon
MKTFQLEIKTPEKKLFSGRVSNLVAPAVDGQIGILPNHASLATILTSGKIRYRLESGQELALGTKKGFLIVARNQVEILLPV